MPKSETSLNELLYDIRRIEQNREKLTEKRIQAIYQTLNDDLDTFLAKTYKQYADADGRMYMSYLDAQRKRAWFLNEIVKNVDNIEPSLRKEMISLVNRTYKECYSGMIDALHTVTTAKEFENIASDMRVRPEVLKQTVNNNISKLTLPTVLEKHRAEIIYKLQQELTIGLLNGDRYETIAKRISEQLDLAEGKAKNIARTETHRNIESGFMDCAEGIQENMEGSDYIYAATWRTMKDEKVRPQIRRRTSKGWITKRSTNGANHMVMEGQTVKVGEMFDLGGGIKAKAPSMSGDAKNDCGCRCFIEYNLLTVEEFAALTGMTPEQVRRKYGMDKNYNPQDSVTEEPISEIESTNDMPTPKTLERFDDYQEQWVNDRFKNMPEKQKEILQKGVQTVIDNNAYSMRVHSKDLQSIIDNGFKNQLETKTSGGTLSAANRKLASQRLFNADVMNMQPSDFEKYGYLGSYDFAVDAATSDAWQYGKTIVKFSKKRLKDRVTYTVDDSLGNALYNRVVGGKIGEKCSISGMDEYSAGYLSDLFKYSKHADLYNADEVAQAVGCRYWELQFHGELTADDIDSICFTGTDRPTTKIVKQLKERGIKVYKLSKGKTVEL